MGLGLTSSRPEPRGDRLVPLGAWLVALGFFAVVAAFGSRYGFHRDELYFVEAGRHPAWGYPDQPPLVPLLAAAWDTVSGDRLWTFRLLPALIAAAVAPLAAAISAELDGQSRDRVWTALLSAVMTVTVAVGHLFSTSTFYLTFTVALILVTLRALRLGGPARWLVVGLIAGLALQVQLLPGFVLACGLAAMALVGPRAPLRSPWPWAAALLATAISAPYLLWQAHNGWPQFEVAASVAAGNSTSSVPKVLVIPLQLVMTGPFLAPVLLVGIWQLARSDGLRRWRWLALTYGLLLALITVTGGKPYYASALVPVMLAAGAPTVRAWLRTRARRWMAGALLCAHVVGTALICLPMSPPGSIGYQIAVGANPDAGETVGWDRLVAQVRDAAAEGAAEVVLTRNYGEAGALDRARGHGVALPPVFSGHNGYGDWGPPPEVTTRVLVVGWFEEPELDRWFGNCRQIGEIDTGVDNEEDGAPIRLCSAPRRPWSVLWPELRHNG